MSKIIFWVVLFATAPAWGAGVADYGYGVLRWDLSESNPNVDYYVDASASSESTEIAAAIADWTSIPTVYLTMTEVGSASAAKIVIKMPSALSISGAAGVAYPRWDSSGHLSSCTVNVSSDFVSNASSDMDVQGTFEHEIGHCLGLVHSVSAGAIMSYRWPKTNKATDDDKFALTLLYPKSGLSGSLPMGCATVSPGSHDGPRGGAGRMWEALLLLGFFVAVGKLSGRTRRPSLRHSRYRERS